MTKAIIIGASASGKTKLLLHLKENTDLPLGEIDEELTKINGGIYPIDAEQKHKVLAPQVINDVLSRDSILFFTNTDYFTPEDLQKGREKGFKVFQLSLDLEKLKQRNQHRVEHEGYSDLSQWFEGMLKYQEQIKSQGLVDKEISTDQPVENVAKELLESLE